MSWPTKEESLANLRVGAWATFCCICDLHQVETEEEVADLREDLLDEEIDATPSTIWPTHEAAVADLGTYEDPK